MVGDVVLTTHGDRFEGGYAGKIYVLAPNVAMGWSGKLTLASLAIRRVREGLGGRVATTEDLGRVLDSLGDLRGGRDSLDLTGWIVAAEGPRVIRWASYFDPVRFSDTENAIGDGGAALRRMLAEPEIGMGNSEGYDTAPLKLVSGFLEARFEEAFQGRDWPRTWGAAYDALAFQEGNFRWLPKLSYVGWDVHLDEQDRIVSITQAPVIFTQEHVHPCTLMFTKPVGSTDHEVQVSTPIDRAVDIDAFLRRPYSAASYYYANYFRVFEPSNHLLKLCLAAKQATPKGVMCHVGADDSDPRFSVNVPVLQPMVNDLLSRARARARETPTDSPA